MTGPRPSLGKLKLEIVEAAGKTLLPGLIDVHVHLGSPGGSYESAASNNPSLTHPAGSWRPISTAASPPSRAPAISSTNRSRSARSIASGRKLGAELFVCGPMFTAEGGHGTEYIDYMPPMPQRARARADGAHSEDRRRSAASRCARSKQAGVDGVKAILECGLGRPRDSTGSTPRCSRPSPKRRAPKICRSWSTPATSKDVADALDAGVAGIEHGSYADEIPDALFARMVQGGVTYDPTLSVINAFAQGRRGQAAVAEPVAGAAGGTEGI